MKKGTYSFDLNVSKLHKQLVLFFRSKYSGWELYQNHPIRIDGKVLYADLYFKTPHPLIVECHGVQHYEFIPYFFKSAADFEHAQELDRLKKLWAEINGFAFIEVDGREEFDETAFNTLLMRTIMAKLRSE